MEAVYFFIKLLLLSLHPKKTKQVHHRAPGSSQAAPPDTCLSKRAGAMKAACFGCLGKRRCQHRYLGDPLGVPLGIPRANITPMMWVRARVQLEARAGGVVGAVMASPATSPQGIAYLQLWTSRSEVFKTQSSLE